MRNLAKYFGASAFALSILLYLSVHRSADVRSARPLDLELQSSACVQIEREATKLESKANGPKIPWIGPVCQHFSPSFRNCCRSIIPPLSNSCLELCDFDATIYEFKAKFLKGPPVCQSSALQKMLSCAADKSDVRRCCQKRGVYDEASQHCLQFCDPSNSILWNAFFSAEARYLKCVEFFETFMYCFLEKRLKSAIYIQGSTR